MAYLRTSMIESLAQDARACVVKRSGRVLKVMPKKTFKKIIKKNWREKMKIFFMVLVTLCVFVTMANLAAVPETGPQGPPYQWYDVFSDYPAQQGKIKNPAIQAPYQFAWELFCSINKTSPVPNLREWEYWPNQNDVYNDPIHKPVWEKIVAISLKKPSQLRKTDFSAHGLLCTPQDGFEEVHMNRATFDYIVNNDLWYLEGQIDAFKKGIVINFPTGAIEVKANWFPIEENQKDNYLSYTNPQTGQIYGLFSMHITSKDLPNWFWCTFEHKDNPCYGKSQKPNDHFGFVDGKITNNLLAMFKASGLDPARWSNYRLDGVQYDFTDPTGRPVILGNSITEDGFQTTASCMTCHSRSTINGKGERLYLFNCSGQSYNGIPDLNWYFAEDVYAKPGLKFLQLDFVWSLGQARSRKNPDVTPQNALGNKENCK